MPSVPVYNSEGKEIEKVTLPDSLFAVKGNPVVVQQAVLAQLANRRQVLAHTKTRGEVRGGGKKPWRQKGTGRARHGSTRSPIWKGGGVTFGPRKDRNYSMKITVKARRKALAMSLTEKVKDKKFIVIDTIAIEKPKTKIIAALLKKLPVGKRVLAVYATPDLVLQKSMRNLEHVEMIRANSLNVYEIVRHDTLLVMKPAIDVMVKTFGKKSA